MYKVGKFDIGLNDLPKPLIRKHSPNLYSCFTPGVTGTGRDQIAAYDKWIRLWMDVNKISQFRQNEVLHLLGW